MAQHNLAQRASNVSFISPKYYWTNYDSRKRPGYLSRLHLLASDPQQILCIPGKAKFITRSLVYTHHEVTAASYADVARMYFLDSDRVDSLDQRMQMNFPAKLYLTKGAHLWDQVKACANFAALKALFKTWEKQNPNPILAVVEGAERAATLTITAAAGSASAGDTATDDDSQDAGNGTNNPAIFSEVLEGNPIDEDDADGSVEGSPPHGPTHGAPTSPANSDSSSVLTDPEAPNLDAGPADALHDLQRPSRDPRLVTPQGVVPIKRENPPAPAPGPATAPSAKPPNPIPAAPEAAAMAAPRAIVPTSGQAPPMAHANGSGNGLGSVLSVGRCVRLNGNGRRSKARREEAAVQHQQTGSQAAPSAAGNCNAEAVEAPPPAVQVHLNRAWLAYKEDMKKVEVRCQALVRQVEVNVGLYNDARQRNAELEEQVKALKAERALAQEAAKAAQNEKQQLFHRLAAAAAECRGLKRKIEEVESDAAEEIHGLKRKLEEAESARNKAEAGLQSYRNKYLGAKRYFQGDSADE